MARTLIAGNWKMNGLLEDVATAITVAEKIAVSKSETDCLICPPVTLLATMHLATKAGKLLLGGQSCHSEISGAHTGDISAQMLADAGASHVIVGHSERRTDHAETDERVAAQSMAALAAGLVPVICIGETLAQREAGETLSYIETQLARSVPDRCRDRPYVIAYEPVWAIGTGLTPSIEQINEVHDSIRTLLVSRFGKNGEDVQILYGGSMKPDNAAEILSVRNVNGGLIGGASLKAEDFLAIYAAAG